MSYNNHVVDLQRAIEVADAYLDHMIELINDGNLTPFDLLSEMQGIVDEINRIITIIYASDEAKSPAEPHPLEVVFGLHQKIAAPAAGLQG